MTTTENTRKMPTEGVFINYDSNDILYSLMYSFATYNPNEERLYMPKTLMVKNKKMIYDTCGFSGSAMVKRHLEKLIAKGLLAQDENNYYFPQNANEKYRIIKKEMLYYLTTTRSVNAIRIYMILLDGYLWKQKEGSEFTFTNTFLLNKLGYSTKNPNANTMVSNILKSLFREGVIKFEEGYEQIITAEGQVVPMPTKYLKFVATTEQEIQN